MAKKKSWLPDWYAPKKEEPKESLGYKAGAALGTLGRSAGTSIKGAAKSYAKKAMKGGRGGLTLFDKGTKYPSVDMFPKGKRMRLI